VYIRLRAVATDVLLGDSGRVVAKDAFKAFEAK
jgi:hypothetical protein